MVAAQWTLGDLSGWDNWLTEEDPAPFLRDEIGTWIARLTEAPWQAPSVPVMLNPPQYDWEARTADVGEFGIGVDYRVNNLVNRIDIRFVGA